MKMSICLLTRHQCSRRKRQETDRQKSHPMFAFEDSVMPVGRCIMCGAPMQCESSWGTGRMVFEIRPALHAHVWRVLLINQLPKSWTSGDAGLQLLHAVPCLDGFVLVQYPTSFSHAPKLPYVGSLKCLAGCWRGRLHPVRLEYLCCGRQSACCLIWAGSLGNEIRPSDISVRRTDGNDPTSCHSPSLQASFTMTCHTDASAARSSLPPHRASFPPTSERSGKAGRWRYYQQSNVTGSSKTRLAP
ncbi:hypothetical protein CH063_06939 [Colletotrichum higginsianum]|uniref:Uncharacterized protein n=1 Tax=Colletotrichum higginsianum (strain IMI 349063) TaxID=759273 RepID=H1V4C6_COLHI|nr:hypothetical protein CH063_06939 [Colletotrichum higginsianum]